MTANDEQRGPARAGNGLSAAPGMCALAMTLALSSACATAGGDETHVVATTASHATQTPPAARSGRVIVDVVGVQNAQGQVLVALFRSARGFPDRGAGAFASQVQSARPGVLQIVFERVPAGPFAVTVHHDADADFTMDTGVFGIPQEGYGFSRDASAPFGPPDFTASRLVLAAGQDKRIRIRLRY